VQIKTHDVGSEIHAENGEKLNDCRKEEVVDLARRSGYVLFRGFAPDVVQYEAFTTRFGTCANTREVHYPDSGAGLGFHAEDAYNPYRPDTIWFFCAFEGSDGGVPTGVVDGVELLHAMPPRWQSFCRSNGIRFDRQWNAETWQSAPPVTSREELERAFAEIPGIEYRFLPDDSLHIGYETPLVVRTPDGRESFANTLLQAATDPEYYGMTLADGSPIPEELLAVAEELALERERHVGWKTGDVAVIDNLRMMHRRSEYHQRDRDLRVRHCEDFFGTTLPDAGTPIAAWAKKLIQGDVELPARVGRPSGAEAVGARAG
jgi:hypothetical protein